MHLCELGQELVAVILILKSQEISLPAEKLLVSQ
jgi:hypothetical protein